MILLLPSLLHLSLDMGGQLDHPIQPTSILLLYMIREKLLGQSLQYTNSVGSYIDAIGDTDHRKYFTRSTLEASSLHFEKIKSMKGQLFDDCLYVFRTNLGKTTDTCRAQFYRFVDGISGTERIGGPGLLTMPNLSSAQPQRQLSKCVLSNRALQVIQ